MYDDLRPRQERCITRAIWAILKDFKKGDETPELLELKDEFEELFSGINGGECIIEPRLPLGGR